MKIISDKISPKIISDTKWNLLSFFSVGISGLLLNILIVIFYSPEVLGVFNLYYVIFILLSEIFNAGIFLSVLNKSSQNNNYETDNNIVMSGILAAFINATLWFIILYFLIDVFKIFFDTRYSFSGVYLLLPALIFYSVNKVFLSYINGKKRMKLYAVVHSLRPILMICILLFIIYRKIGYRYLSLIFLISEVILFIVLFLILKKYISYKFIDYKLIINHFKHGYKVVLGNIFMDLNTRVDILMLGYFVNERLVGIYSFASMIVEGFNQLPIVFRTIINPYLTEIYNNNKIEIFLKKINYGRNLTYIMLVPLGLIFVIVYPSTLKILAFYDEYSLSIIPFTILMLGIIISIGYKPLSWIFNQINFPTVQTLLFSLLFFTNIILNILLIPFLGIIGAAMATSMSYLFLIVYFNYLLFKLVIHKK